MKYIAFPKLFDQKILEGVSNEDKSTVKILIESLKKEKPLSELYYLINSIVVPDETLTEAIIPEYINHIKLVTRDLVPTLGEYNTLFESSHTKQGDSYTQLERDINTLFFEKNTTHNIVEKSQAYTNICNHLKECVKQNQGTPQLQEQIAKYDTLVESLSEDNRQILKEFWGADNKELAFNKVKDRTINYLLEHMEKDDNTAQIEKAIVKIIKIKYQPDNYVKNVVELLNLTND